ncbi:hypothetical protein JTZ62_04550 [Mammaliicoccus sciuri]|uniref:hypothetical protein n=1 Tax=Mammaliicoccus sciuri TaxID=1296 RepID=UPI0019D3A84F|nr:hypothetical protein [Mammaliicoccus sciuri]QSN68428.1 hypothetical protein JTZ62_04550 [Mammaliicoccus sciuri]UIU23169.1 hypothetical protein LLZ87_04560 [Mammaliicoccus sciuri]UIU26074.1 hypothetical protein LLZ92_04560 [Mammaliicoccus sciuri]
MKTIKQEFLNNYKFMDIENHNNEFNADQETLNGQRENEIINNIFDYVLQNNLMNDETETINCVLNDNGNLKVMIHNLDTDNKRYVLI